MSKIINSRLLAGLLVVAMMVFIAPASQAAVIGNLTLAGTPAQGNGNGSFTVSGTCPSGGTVNYSIVNNGNTTNLGSEATNSGGNFSNSSLLIPAGYTTGSGSTLVATCSNGDTLTLAVNVLAAPELLILNTTAPDIDGNISVTGNCTTSNGNGVVTFTLTRGGVVTNLSSTTSTNSNGTFTNTVSIPSTYPTGLATLTATCPNGQVVSTLAVIGDPNLINLTLSPNTVNVGGTITATGVCPTSSSGVTFSVLQNGTTTPLGNGVTSVNSNGTFSSTMTLPTTVTTGSANVIATCNNNGGSTTSGLVLGVATNLPATPVPTGSVAGVSTTPVGGVAAGSGGTADSGALQLFFLLTGVVATALLFAGRNMQENS